MGEGSNCRQVVAGERKAAHLVVAEEHTADQVCRVEDSAEEEERMADRVCKVEGSAEEAAYKVDLAEQAEQAEQAGAHRTDYRQDRQEQGYTERTWAEGSSTSEQGSTEEGARTNATTPVVQSWAGKAEPCRGTSDR